jgi:hypothetical protein
LGHDDDHQTTTSTVDDDTTRPQPPHHDAQHGKHGAIPSLAAVPSNDTSTSNASLQAHAMAQPSWASWASSESIFGQSSAEALSNEELQKRERKREYRRQWYQRKKQQVIILHRQSMSLFWFC